MDYKQEYIDKNPDLHESDTESKVRNIDKLLFPIAMKVTSIVDVACGSGKILLNISKKYSSKKNLGIDISDKMIEVAKTNDINNNVTWKVANVFDVKLDNYELVLAIDILEHVESDLGFLKHIKNIGRYLIVKVPIEKNFLNILVKIISFGKIDEYKYTEEKYGHINHYSEKDLLNLIDESELMVIGKGYMHLPKRSKVFWEILRIVFFPMWWLSKSLYLKFNGGFLVLLLIKNDE